MCGWSALKISNRFYIYFLITNLDNIWADRRMEWMDRRNRQQKKQQYPSGQTKGKTSVYWSKQTAYTTFVRMLLAVWNSS